MKTKLIICFILTMFSGITSFAQQAKDVLERGTRIKTGEKVYLYFDGTSLKYNLSGDRLDPHALADSSLFLTPQTGVNIVMAPVNPLSYSYKSDTTFVIDPVNQSAAGALAQITDVLALVANGVPSGRSGEQDSLYGYTDDQPVPAVKERSCEYNLQSLISRLGISLANDRKAEVASIFTALKNLSFLTEQSTASGLATNDTKIAGLEAHFARINVMLDSLDLEIKKYSCPDGRDTFMVRYAYNQLAKDLRTLKNEQFKRVEALRNAYKVVNTAYLFAADNGWWIPLRSVNPTEKKNVVLSVTISTGGYRLSDENEIVAVTAKETVKRIIVFRNFDWWVPEVAAGVAYTWLSFPEFGTETDSATGVIRVASAGENIVRRINFTTMINFNFYIPQSSFHPFWQIGAGMNAGYPTLLLGVGGRFRVLGQRISFSTGFAASWVKTLDTLEIGDEISGDAELTKDIRYEFSRNPKMYFGIQYNF